ncbi:hypothetical protein SAMN05443574_11122 [Haloarcula vallismortis]|uniref:DUF2304 domain-containing protein n=2 Tax=Haloarcula vallismortis TaxID=28442 RepID=M0IZ63_HALVA|nr:DUF2304 domain-containing protein [Haloarcula vallismortis]EMA02001.1 hypothetical protein C437_16326 [Haloarcula vallismortis ATCC 29715]SDW98305.1 hypothetical protein SAMN05443574_11122 [Haloarcula vallismortis]
MVFGFDYSLVNLLSLAVGLAFLANGYIIVRSERESLELFVMSLLLGAGLIVVAIVPNVFEVVARLLGLEWKARAILVISNLTLFVAVTYLLNRIGHMYDRLSRLNEELSLLRSELEEHQLQTEDEQDD